MDRQRRKRINSMQQSATSESNSEFELIKNVRFFSFDFIFIVQVIALWSVWKWLALRVWTSTEERWSFLALAAAIFFIFFWRKSDSIGKQSGFSQAHFSFFGLGLSIVLTFLYAASFAFSPPLPRAILAMTALTLTLSVWRLAKPFYVGLWCLLLLSLPTAASLQFFLGYPLRVVVGKATAFLLQMQGLDVWREGVLLHFGEKLVWIDAPCSGIKMLWFGLFLASFSVCFYRLSNFKSLAVLGSAFIIILLGNIFRASALFYIEAEIIKAPSFMHEAVGVFAFTFTAVGIIFAAQFWRNLPSRAWTRFFQNMLTPKATIQSAMCAEIRIFIILFFTGCFTAFFTSYWLSAEKTIKPVTQNFGVFPATFEGFEIKELPLSERESYFLEDFPGHIGRFSDGKREIIIRYVREATRKLHPADDCFRAIGYSTKPLPLKVDEEGKRWSCFAAVKADEKLRVCERIYNFEGDEWTDVSSWYWSALGKSYGEWWAVTVAERGND